ncbi:MAG: hypothetical protein WBN04_20375 [Paracoccaceae bacterium]
METVADIFLISASLAAAIYCIVLSRRLKRFTDLENGVGGAIAVLSAQVDDMTKTLERAQSSATGSADSLGQLSSRAEEVAGRLELLVASMHDLPEPGRSAPAQPELMATPEPEETTPDEPLFLSKRARVPEAAE